MNAIADQEKNDELAAILAFRCLDLTSVKELKRESGQKTLF
jgi:hypothetical protein